MIEEVKVTRYRAVCDHCGRRFGLGSSQSAEYDLRTHECGEHRRQYDNTGGFRGILGGWNVSCVCGESWVVPDPSTPFACPQGERELMESGEECAAERKAT